MIINIISDKIIINEQIKKKNMKNKFKGDNKKINEKRNENKLNKDDNKKNFKNIY